MPQENISLKNKLLSVEALCAALSKVSYEARMMLQAEEVSTSPNAQPLTHQQLAMIAAKQEKSRAAAKLRRNK